MRQKVAILVLLTAILKLASSQYDDVCYPNEVFSPSVNPCNTCDIRGYCPDNSGPGCDCASGLYRNSEGVCVPPQACEAYYGPNGPYGQHKPPDTSYDKKVPTAFKCTGSYEEFKSCGSACPLTCDKYIRPPCAEQCVPGCFCTEGYVRNKLGVCVRPEQCDITPAVLRPRCAANEEYTDCGTSCPPTCENRFPICILRCVKGCFCRRGYVRKDGKCVSPQECEYARPPPIQTCGRNEVFSACGTACPPTCENPRPQACTEQCIRGCFCRRGFVRRNGICVLPQECDIPRGQPGPPRCGANEIFSDCGTACPPTCQNPRPQRCTLQCVRGCFCRSGFVRLNRRCVREQECRIYNTPPIIPQLTPIPPYPSPTPSISGRRYRYPNPIRLDPPMPVPPPLPKPIPYPPPTLIPFPNPPILPPVTVPPPTITPGKPNPPKVCPNRFQCNRYCREQRKMLIGFCIGPNFLECQCWGP